MINGEENEEDIALGKRDGHNVKGMRVNLDNIDAVVVVATWLKLSAQMNIVNESERGLDSQEHERRVLRMLAL